MSADPPPRITMICWLSPAEDRHLKTLLNALPSGSSGSGSFRAIVYALHIVLPDEDVLGAMQGHDVIAFRVRAPLDPGAATRWEQLS